MCLYVINIEITCKDYLFIYNDPLVELYNKKIMRISFSYELPHPILVFTLTSIDPCVYKP